MVVPQIVGDQLIEGAVMLNVSGRPEQRALGRWSGVERGGPSEPCLEEPQVGVLLFVGDAFDRGLEREP